MATIEQQILTKLYRVICPDPIALGEYHLGLLSSIQNKQIRQHLNHCPHCRQELRVLENYLPDSLLSHAPSFNQRIKSWIAERILLQPAPDMAKMPALALRGEVGNTGPLLYRAGDVQLSLEIQDDPDNPGYKMILGLILGTGTALSAMEAHLRQEERPLAASQVDESGNFIFNHLPEGQYELIVTGSDREIHVQNLSIESAKYTKAKSN